MQLATEDDIEMVKTYYREDIGFDDTFGYVANLVNRQELYLYKEADVLVATGECRLSDTQPQVADVGISVRADRRKQG